MFISARPAMDSATISNITGLVCIVWCITLGADPHTTRAVTYVACVGMACATTIYIAQMALR